MRPCIRTRRSRRIALALILSTYAGLIPIDAGAAARRAGGVSVEKTWLPASLGAEATSDLMWLPALAGRLLRSLGFAAESSIVEQQDVQVNRTVPTVTPPPSTPQFSAAPDAAEITRARVFGEPLVPIGDAPAAAESAALAQAILTYAAAGGGDRVASFTAFLAQFPSSSWRASLLANLGVVYRHTGHFSKALTAWEQAWTLARDADDPKARAVADQALGELLELNSRLGRFDALTQLIAAADTRQIRGSANQRVSAARQALWAMNNEPGDAFRCGPFALDEVLRNGSTTYQTPEPIQLCKSTRQGTSLAQLKEVAAQVGATMRIAHRPPGGEILVPAVVHWHVGHFAALVRQEGDRVLLRDPTFGGDLWMSVAALDEEASGYALLDTRPLPAGWRVVGDEEGATVWGKGNVAGAHDDDLNDNRPRCPTCPGGGGPGGPGGPPARGMTAVSVQMMLISTTLDDTPIWYTPPRGPAVEFKARYNQRDKFQPQTFSYSNLGLLWTFDWLSYVEDDPTNPAADLKVYLRGAGRDKSTGYSAGAYAPTIRSQAVVTRTSTSPLRYERQLPDGSIEVFAQPDGALTFPRKVFLTEIRDARGQALTFTWDGQFRIVAATDAVGQVTTLAYELAGDPLKITKVTDPFGRTATFTYDGTGRLASITDLLGLTSSFTYGPRDTVATLTTPYGTTRVMAGEEGGGSPKRWAELTDPLGGRARVHYGDSLGFSDPDGVPAGVVAQNTDLSKRTTLYWDALAMARAPEQASSATEYVWMWVEPYQFMASSAIHSIKRPLERRVWHAYQGGNGLTEGTVRQVSQVGRILDDGTSQVTRSEYNTRGQRTKAIDPLGRETVYEYAANGLDLLVTKQKNGAGFDILETRTYNGQHLPLTITDASGQTTTLTYNASGQVVTVTNAKNETTTYAYDSDGRLTSITGPVAGATTTFTYDALSRVRTVTDSDGYTVTTDYDAAGRPTRTTYPDGTFEESIYEKLDVGQRRDRLGRITRMFYDANRRLTATRDPLGRMVTQSWCSCGSLDALVDANGNRTRWERDIQGRVTKEIRADGRETLYAYEATTGRLKSMTDAKNQVTTYNYFLDDKVKDILYTNEQIATPDVSFTYDATYGRQATMVDGTGTTSYGYHAVAPPALGATRLASVDGPLTNDTITYSYDELGRVTTRAIDAVGVTWTFDALGRVTTEVNVLGTFTYGYDGPTDRMASVAYPNNQTSTYSYFPNANDHRLQTIHHKYPNGSTLSKFDYTYNAVGNILTWRQQADNDAVQWEYGYDAADQLTAAVKKATDPQQTVQKRYAYAYDPGGNRTIEQIDDSVSGFTYNNVNELVTQVPAGAMVFEGTVNEPATVTVAGKPVTVTPDTRFRGTAPIVSGTNTVSVVATDPSGNATTRQYQVSNAAASKTFTFDANGNLTADGTRTFEWDARNQLVAVTVGTHRSEFTYDGLHRRFRVVEKEAGVTQSDMKVVWCDAEICDERSADGATVSRRAFSLGEEVGGAARFFATDHLGSVGVVSNSLATVVSGYDFDPWGQRTLTAGNDVSQVGFTGHRWQPSAALWLTQYRGYDAALGRWISQDPIGEQGGLNLYTYSLNQPLTLVDPDGRNPAVAAVHGARGGAVVGGSLGGPVGAAVGGAIGGVVAGGLAAWITWPRPEPPPTTPTTEVPKNPPVDCPPPPDNPCVLAALCLKAAKGVMAKARCVPLIIACLGSGLQ